MKEREEIDQLFREQLFGREAELDANAAEKAMELLIAEDSAIASKKRKRFAFLFSFVAVIVLSCILLLFRRDEHSEQNATTSESPSAIRNESNAVAENNTPIDNTESPEHLEKTNNTTEAAVGETLSSDDIPQNNHMEPFTPENHDESTPAHLKSSSNPKSITLLEPQECFETSLNEVKDAKAINNNSPIHTSINQSTLEKVGTSNIQINAPETLMKDVDAIQEINQSDSTKNVQSKAIFPIIPIEIKDSTNIVNEISHDVTTLEDSLAQDQKTLENNEPLIELLPTKTNSQFFIGMCMIQNNGMLKSNQEEQRNYISQRNEQESEIISYGFDAGIARSLGRSSVLFGLGYYQSGEKIAYSGKSTTQEYDTTIVWDYRTYVLQIVDASPSGGIINYDTTYVVAHSDSTLIQQIDSTSFTSENKKISAKNGITKIHHITVPITYQYRFIQKNKLCLSAGIGLEADYRLSAKASYLMTDQQDIASIDTFGGYRKMMINGSANLELQYRPGINNLSIAIGAGLKRNMYSWNKDFDHRYTMPYIRCAIGYFFK